MGADRRKLTAEEAVDMRELYASGDYTMRTLAEMYGVAPITAWKVIKGYSYQEATGGEPVELPGGKHTYKKAGKKGEEHPQHLLQAAEVLEIRRKIAKDGAYGKRMKLYAALAYQYGVAQTTISGIASSSTWRHLPSVEELRKKRRK